MPPAGLAHSMPREIANKIGAGPSVSCADRPLPTTPLDWALHWAARGVSLFPCKSFLGVPIVSKWYTAASSQPGQLVEWWSETRDADIGAVPDKSGHFVLAAIGGKGRESLKCLEKTRGPLCPEFRTETRWGDYHLWFAGKALTSYNVLGPGLHVLGAGTFVYMPASLAPDPDWSA